MLRLGLLLPPGFSVMSFTPIAAFEAANLIAGERFYDLRILSETGEPLTNSLGWTMNTEPLGESGFDTLMVGSGPNLVSPSPRTIAFLREAVATTRRIASLPIEVIARETGFGDRERMRRSFLRSFGATPQSLRNAAHPLATL